MDYLTQTFVIAFAFVILYSIASWLFSVYAVSNGKTNQQIINHYTAQKENFRFTKKYPEADIHKERKTFLALGFIFAFASAIYILNVLGKEINYTFISESEVTSTAVIPIAPPVHFKEVQKVKKYIPPVIPKKVNISTQPKVVEQAKPKESSPAIIPEPSTPIDYVEPEVVENKTYVKVESMPKFRGCEHLEGKEAERCTEQAIQQYAQSIHIPQKLIHNRVKGKVYVNFVINQQGKVSQVKLLRKAGNALDQLALKHIKKMPQFASMGIQSGKKVSVQYTIPIIFEVE